MRSVVCLLAVVCLLSSTVSAQQTLLAYGTAQALTQASTTYAFGGTALLPVAPFLTINSVGAASGTFTLDVVANFQASLGIAGVPDGFGSLGLGLVSGQLGFNLSLSAGAAVTINATLTTPAITALVGGAITGQLVGVLSYDVQTATYVRIPAERVSVSSLGAVSINLPGAGVYYIVNINTAPIAKQIDSSIVVVGNTAQNLTITEANRVALTLRNIQAAAGLLSVRVSAQANARVAAAQSTGRVAVSTIYNLTHTAAVTSVELRYDLTASAQTAGSFVASTAAWYKWDVANNVWVAQNSRIEGNVVVFVTTGFSEWSVQATNATANNNNNNTGRNAATTLTVPALTIFFVAALSLFFTRFF